MMTKREAQRRLIGRRIVDVQLNRYWAPGTPGKWMTDPQLVLDDGTLVGIMTQENPEGGEYGHELIVSARRAKP